MLVFSFMLAFIIILVLQTAAYRFFALRGFDYGRELSRRRVYEGEKIELKETIANNSFLPIPWLKAESRFDETLLFTRTGDTRVSAGAYHRSAFSIPPYRRIKRTYELVCSKRGYYRLGTSTITTGDIVGLANKTKTYGFDTELYVYPIPLPQNKWNLPSHSWQGDLVVRRYIQPDPFMPAGVRDYMPGDPLSYINWKASAKTGRLAVHRHDFTADARLCVFFNIDSSADQWGAADQNQAAGMEFAIRVLAAILDRAVSLGQSTALYTNALGRRDEKEICVPPGFGHGQREAIFSALAEMQIKRSRSFHMLLRAHSEKLRNADVLIMSRYITKEIETEAGNMRKTGNNVELLFIPAQNP